MKRPLYSFCCYSSFRSQSVFEICGSVVKTKENGCQMNVVAKNVVARLNVVVWDMYCYICTVFVNSLKLIRQHTICYACWIILFSKLKDTVLNVCRACTRCVSRGRPLIDGLLASPLLDHRSIYTRFFCIRTML